MATYKNKNYDLVEAFRVIEDELISSISRNLEKHIKDEETEGFNWSMWQVEQLNALNEYKIQSQKFYDNYVGLMNSELDAMYWNEFYDARLSEERDLLFTIKNGFKADKSETNFFKVNEKKLNSLIGATKSDFKDATKAMLRTSADEYRKIIFNAQVYANTGAGTVRQAIDMATKDFLAKGINCIEYSNGAKVPIDSYAEMALRTTNTRAVLHAEGGVRKNWNVTTVCVTPNSSACPVCLKWVNQIYIDDVWSGGTKKDGNYPLLSTAIEGGLYHPNCRDSHSTYYEGVSTKPKAMTKEEKAEAERVYKLTQQQRYCERNVRKYKRMAEYSLDADNKAKYQKLTDKWNDNLKSLVKSNPELRFKSDRVKTYGIDLNNLKWSDSPNAMKQKALKKLDDSMSQLEVKIYSNIWKDDVTVKDYASKKGSIQAKKDYFENKLLYGYDQKFADLLDELNEFEKNGKLYETLQDEKLKLTATKKKTKKVDANAYAKERKDNALWFTGNDRREKADAVFRPETGEVWKQLSKEEKYALYDYTHGSGKFNRPLSGFEGGWDNWNYKGIGKVNLDYEGGASEIKAMTSALEKTSSKSDRWLQRGCGNEAMDSFIGATNSGKFGRMSDKELQSLVGQMGEITSFVSCGSAKGDGFDSDVILNIYCPKGTKLMYAEPFSHYGRSHDYYNWNGVSDPHDYGFELETIIQRGYKYRITKVERTGYKTYIDMECLIELGNNFIK